MSPSRLLVPGALLVAGVLLQASAPARIQGDGVSVTFLANEGVMLAGGGRRVLIDALFEKYKGDFAIAADSTQLALRNARAPFDSVNLILVTHHHGDHFQPAPVVAHLRANPRVAVLASQQVVDSLRGRITAADIGPRVMARAVARGASRRDTVNGVPITVLGLAHHDLQHYGYIVEIGGRRVLHVGDTDDGAKSFPAFRLDTMRIDVALLPQWMGMRPQGREMIERWIKPRHVAFIHLGSSERSQRDAESAIRAMMPEATVFTRSLETRRW
jgi:L-ascorbate metabolism protein UlaG (beta-lactamase superfamily)